MHNISASFINFQCYNNTLQSFDSSDWLLVCFVLLQVLFGRWSGFGGAKEKDSSVFGFLLNSVQLLSRVQPFMTPWSVARQASLSITNSWSLLKLMCIESVMLFNHLILCCPLLLLPSIFPSIRVLSNESVLGIRGPKYRSFGFSISPPTEYSGLISFRMTGWISLQSKELSRVFSNTTVQKHQFFGALPSLWSNSLHDYWKKHSFTYTDLCQQSNAFAF